jgi:D-3-phosphoglycerate dehydrogenase / 2-oxoglutarate reductase
MTARNKLLVPDTMGRAGLEILEARPDVSIGAYPPAIPAPELHALLGDAVGIALSFTRFGRAELQAAPLLKVAARIGVGFDAVDVPALTERGVPLMVVGTANATSVAEQAVYLMLAVAKRGADMDRRVRQGLWQDRRSGLPTEVARKTVLIVGFGRIGTRTAPRCQALGMSVLVYDPYVASEAIIEAGCQPAHDLDVALGQADFVSIHCPKDEGTIGLFGAARLARMKPGAVLVNTARGGIIDERALHEALVSGHLAGAGLDVFETEPPSTDNPLFGLETVVVSPHVAGVTVEAFDAMLAMTARNLLSVIDGAPIRENVVNQRTLG